MTPSWYHRNLTGGETGRDVDVVQRLLMAPATRVYDDETQAFVRGVQLMYRLIVNGVVDSDTAAAIGETVEAHLPPEWFVRPLHFGMHGEDVAALRQVLHLTAGECFDEETQRAVLRYQSANHLPLTGTVNKKTAYHIHGYTPL